MHSLATRPETFRRVFFVGAAQQARLCQLILEAEGHSVPIVYDELRGIAKPFECELFHDDAHIEIRAKSCDSFLVCISRHRGALRTNFSTRLLQAGLDPISAIHPTAYFGRSSKLGRGLQAMPHAVVSEWVTIGDWCILNTNCTVDHGTQIGDGVHIMGGASVAGEVEVGNFATIGTNATVLPLRKIGTGAYVGAGAVVTKDVSDYSVVVGVPARPIGRPIYKP
jgi:sugar O-acyltransferase (sialic acid O-acetyltransferase NeuD family)